MKKIVGVRKALKSLAAALALTTTLSGCSFDNTKEVVKDNTVAYETTDESKTIESVSNVSVENKNIDSEERVINAYTLEETTKDETVNPVLDNDESFRKNPYKNDAEKDITVSDNKTKAFVVMFDGELLVIPDLSLQFKNGEYVGNSINAALEKAGYSKDYDYRAKLAKFFSISNYAGTKEQNPLLLSYLRNPEIYMDMSLVIKTINDIGEPIVALDGYNIRTFYTNITDETHTEIGYAVSEDGSDIIKIFENTSEHDLMWEPNPSNPDYNEGSCACGFEKSVKISNDQENKDDNEDDHKHDHNEGNNGGNKDDHKDEEQKPSHQHTYGDLLTKYIDIVEKTHTLLSYRECPEDGYIQEISREKKPHDFDWRIDPNNPDNEIGECVCSYEIVRESTCNHQFGQEMEEYKLVDKDYHEVTVYQICDKCSGKLIKSVTKEKHPTIWKVDPKDSNYEILVCTKCGAILDRREIQKECEHLNTGWRYKDSTHEEEYCLTCGDALNNTRGHVDIQTNTIVLENSYDENGHKVTVKTVCNFDGCGGRELSSAERTDPHNIVDGAAGEWKPSDDGVSHYREVIQECDACEYELAKTKDESGPCVNDGGECNKCHRPMTHSHNFGVWESVAVDENTYCYGRKRTCTDTSCGEAEEEFVTHHDYFRDSSGDDADYIKCGGQTCGRTMTSVEKDKDYDGEYGFFEKSVEPSKPVLPPDDEEEEEEISLDTSEKTENNTSTEITSDTTVTTDEVDTTDTTVEQETEDETQTQNDEQQNQNQDKQTLDKQDDVQQSEGQDKQNDDEKKQYDDQKTDEQSQSQNGEDVSALKAEYDALVAGFLEELDVVVYNEDEKNKRLSI